MVSRKVKTYAKCIRKHGISVNEHYNPAFQAVTDTSLVVMASVATAPALRARSRGRDMRAAASSSSHAADAEAAAAAAAPPAPAAATTTTKMMKTMTNGSSSSGRSTSTSNGPGTVSVENGFATAIVAANIPSRKRKVADVSESDSAPLPPPSSASALVAVSQAAATGATRSHAKLTARSQSLSQSQPQPVAARRRDVANTDGVVAGSRAGGKPQLYASYKPGTAPSDAALRMHVDDLSSDDEAPRNTIGNVPLQWYEQSGYDHIGYDRSGSKIIKKQGKDGIDRFLASQDDPLYKYVPWVGFASVMEPCQQCRRNFPARRSYLCRRVSMAFCPF